MSKTRFESALKVGVLGHERFASGISRPGPEYAHGTETHSRPSAQKSRSWKLSRSQREAVRRQLSRRAPENRSFFAQSIDLELETGPGIFRANLPRNCPLGKLFRVSPFRPRSR